MGLNVSWLFCLIAYLSTVTSADPRRGGSLKDMLIEILMMRGHGCLVVPSISILDIPNGIVHAEISQGCCQWNDIYRIFVPIFLFCHTSYTL